eukprot:1158170-Pelagomonas_calceolata.AAC.3
MHIVCILSLSSTAGEGKERKGRGYIAVPAYEGSLADAKKRLKLNKSGRRLPRFLSKKEREALALERLNAARAGQTGTSSAAAAGNVRMAANGLPLPPPPPTSSTRDRERDRDYDRDRRVEDSGREGEQLLCVLSCSSVTGGSTDLHNLLLLAVCGAGTEGVSGSGSAIGIGIGIGIGIETATGGATGAGRRMRSGSEYSKQEVYVRACACVCV